MKTRIVTLSLLLALVTGQFLVAQPVLRVFSVDPAILQSVKERCRAGDALLLPAYRQLLSEADQSLSAQPVSVVEKKQAPPSGDMHDYMSLARYYWPDTTKPGGLPYVSRDGVPNPEIYEITDATYFGKMNSAVWRLALAYYLTGKPVYAEHAARFLRTWFLDPATAMNPNMKFAQGMKGKKESSFAGIIETRHMYLIVDAIGLLAGSPAWTAADQKGMEQWLGRYVQWLREHPNGIQASHTPNNHGVWFDVQMASISLFLGQADSARSVLEHAKSERIAKQIEPDGSMPKELGRTTSKHYTQFNIEAFLLLASMGRHAGVDLWSYCTPDGRSIRGALEFPIPFIRGEREWTWKDIKPYDWSSMYPFFLRASVDYPDAGFGAIAERVASAQTKNDMIHLLTGR